MIEIKLTKDRRITYQSLGAAFLVVLATYSIKAPVLGVSLYRIVFPYLALFITISTHNSHSSQKAVQIQKTRSITSWCWSMIIVWGTVLAIANNSLSTSIGYLWWDVCFISIVICFDAFLTDDNNTKTALFAYFVFSALVGVSGIIESATGRLYHLTYTSYLRNRNSLGLIRPNTIFYNINDSAVFMCLSLIMAFLLSTYCEKKKAIRFAALFVFGGNIILAESRGALLGMAFFLLFFYSTETSLPQKFVCIAAFMLIAVAVVPAIIEGFDGNYAQLTGLGERGNIWRTSLLNLRKTILLGTGPGNTAVLNQEYGRISAVHNWFLEMLCDYGFVGGGALIIWFVSLIYKAYRLRNMYMQMTIALGGLVCFIMTSISSSSLVGKVWPVCFLAMLTVEIGRYEEKIQN